MAIYLRRFSDYIGQNLNRKWNVVSETLDTTTSLPVLTTYPTADPSKIGKKFMYRGVEWKYFSKEELIDMSLVGFPPGFPAPVSDVPDPYDFFNVLDGKFNYVGFYLDGERVYVQVYSGTAPKIEIDFIYLRRLFDPKRFINGNSTSYPTGLKRYIYMLSVAPFSTTITAIRNAALLHTLEDVGTTRAFTISANNDNKFDVSADVLNDFFKQLPKTTKTATLDVRGASGSTTCTPSIATQKGYTVVTT